MKWGSVAGLCCWVCLAASAQAESADEILRRWDVASKGFLGFSADLKQDSFTKALPKDVAHHTAVIRLRRTDKGIFGLVRYTDDPRSIRFAGDIVEEFLPNANQLNRYDFKKYSGMMRDGLMLGFGTSGKEVRSSYMVTDGGSAMIGSHRTTRIELVPKAKNAKDLVQKIELWIPDGESNPIRTKSTDPGGNSQTFEYSGVKLLKLPLKDSNFDFDADQRPNQSTHVVNMN